MMDFINHHFAAIAGIAIGLVILVVAISIALFLGYKSDAIREHKDDPTSIASAKLISFWKNVLLLRRAVKGDASVAPSRPSQNFDGTITPGTMPAVPDPRTTPVKPIDSNLGSPKP